MIPEQRISSVVVKGKYLVPDTLPNSDLVDYELGGIGLNNPSEGLDYQVWTLEYVSGGMYISSPNTPRILLFEAPDVQQLSFAFDQNMRPFVAFVEGPQPKFWWYDTSVGSAVFTDLPLGCRSLRAGLDDKRESQTAASDIILAYLRDDKLYFRAQRDRYTIEYLLASGLPDADLDRIGMTDKLRLQFRLLPRA